MELLNSGMENVLIYVLLYIFLPFLLAENNQTNVYEHFKYFLDIQMTPNRSVLGQK